MDLGLVGFDGLVGSGTTATTSSFFASSPDPETKLKWYGSGGFLKQERAKDASEEDLRSSKLPKTESLLRSNGQEMLSFSSPNSQTVSLPNYYHHPSTTYSRNTGYGSMNGVYAGLRGPFTPSQWVELEHQALIYKYINANVPIPSNLLIPIRKAFDSAGLYSFSGGPNTLAWGAFRLGFSNSTDPEPGRCRRTDGKKWRCSRDAVADQKYCERHINRGRHRSRKPVEGQSGHSVSGPTNTTANTAKLMPVASSASTSVVPGSSVSNGLGISLHPQIRNQQPHGTNTCASSPNRIFVNKENVGDRVQDSTDLSMFGLKENQFPIPKHQNPYELQSSRAEFGLVCSDSLLNPLQKTSSLITCENYGSSHNPNDKEPESHHSLRQFMDDWPNKTQTDRIQLSISIPMAPTDFTSSTSSPVHSPLRLSREIEPTQMGLGVGRVGNDPNQRQANWIPISWENSMGGPLGEVLNRTNSGIGDYKNSSALNLMTEGWDISPRLGSSPTGVLQKMAFGSLSNSSAGSSPRAENHHRIHQVGASFCNDLLGSSLVKPSTLPAL